MVHAPSHFRLAPLVVTLTWNLRRRHPSVHLGCYSSERCLREKCRPFRLSAPRRAGAEAHRASKMGLAPGLNSWASRDRWPAKTPASFPPSVPALCEEIIFDNAKSVLIIHRPVAPPNLRLFFWELTERERKTLATGASIRGYRPGVVSNSRHYRRPMNWERSRHDHQYHLKLASFPKHSGRPNGTLGH